MTGGYCYVKKRNSLNSSQNISQPKHQPIDDSYEVIEMKENSMRF